MWHSIRGINRFDIPACACAILLNAKIQVATVASTEAEEIKNVLMEGELYLGFADAAPTFNLWSNEKKNPAVLEGDILYFVCILVLRTGYSANLTSF